MPPPVVFTQITYEYPQRYDVGFAVRLWRQFYRLSQRVLALRMGTRRTYISKVENHICEPNLKQFARLSSALGVSQEVVMLCATAACQRIQ